MNTEVIGQPLNRIDGRQKVTGAARYSAEFDFPNRAYAVVVQSAIARGRIVQIDTREAEAQPGVLAVITHLNAPKLSSPSSPVKTRPEDRQSRGQAQRGQGQPGEKLLPLQSDQIYYGGQHIGVVVAETLEQALYAASLVRVRYEAEKPVVEMERQLDHAFPAPSAPGREPSFKRGDPDAGLALAQVRVEQTYITPVEHHNPMEPAATTAVWQGDHLTLYDATQGVTGAEHVVATQLGIPAENVRVISYFLGGGFGCKGSTWPHTVLAAIAARRVGRPVTLALTRGQMFTSAGYRPQTIQRISLGATRDGRLIGIDHTYYNMTSLSDEWVERCGAATGMLYASPDAQVTQRLVSLDRGTPCQARAPGFAPGSFALESAMDELVYALNMDPIELRLRNYAEVDPQKNLPWSSKSLRECYRQGAERFGWDRRDPKPRSMRDGDYLVGLGMATAVYPTNASAAAAKVQIFPDGRARALSGTQDLGTGTYTIMTQIAAETLGIPVVNVHFELGDTTMPTAPTSGGSQTAATVGSAVKAAALAARSKAIRMAVSDTASPLYGLPEDQVSVANGRLFSNRAPNKGETYADLLKRNRMDRLEADGNWSRGEEAKRFSMYAFGAQFAEVHIHPDSGEVRVTRFVGAFGAGRILNAKTARSQVMGGIVWGIGMALTEATIMDPRMGRIVNADLAEYHVPVNADVPAIDAFFVAEEDPYVNLNGSKGIGEIGIVGSAAAVANAVYHATGRRIRELPITPDKLL